MNIAISAGAGILLFLCLFLGYREGLRLGMRASRGTEPTPVKSPVKIVRDIKEQNANRREAEILKSVWEEIDEFDGFTKEEKQRMNGGE